MYMKLFRALLTIVFTATLFYGCTAVAVGGAATGGAAVRYNGVALMVGQAPTESLRQQAQTIVAGIEKVRLVHNEMAITAPNSYMTRTSDSLITAKVKTALFGVRDVEGFDPTRVKVVTEDGMVYLMGLLNRRDADAAAASTSQVSGVEKVVKLFEYID
jgi:osmotically-inducible protein OsmY